MNTSTALIPISTYPVEPSLLVINGEQVKACSCTLGIDQWAYVEKKAAVNFYKAKHKESLIREALLKSQLEEAKADIRLLKQKLFGKSSESSKKREKIGISTPAKPRAKGQQKGSKGHGRRKQLNIPIVDEFVTLNKDEQHCNTCSLPYSELNSTADSEILEIEVKSHIRLIKRQKYKRHSQCKCLKTPIIKTAPALPKLLPKMNLGISIWVDILIRKYDEQCPLNNILTSIGKHGPNISAGTVTGGLQRLLPFLKPVADAFELKCQQDKNWHADETRWKVFEKIEGKKSNLWWLWVFRGNEAITYRIESTRGYIVPEDFFKNVKKGILHCDRYVVYKKLAKNTCIILALCWAHVRRDFLNLIKSKSEFEEWAMAWVNDIRILYQLNKKRLSNDGKSIGDQDEHQKLCQQIHSMEDNYNSQLDDEKLAAPSRKILTSLKAHWKGLIVFVEHPEIKMDNNKGEQSIRPATLGRKVYYGSGSVWSSQLTAILFSIFATLSLWEINSRTWLTKYLRACENNSSAAPVDLSSFLPWEMSIEQKHKLSKPPT